MARTEHRATTREPAAMETGTSGGAPALLRWGAVFGGVVLGLALLLLLAALWMAIGFGTDVAAVRDNLAWYIGVSAIVSMFVGGLVAGWLSGVPGAGPGFFNGLTVWGLILLVSLAIGAPGAGLVGMQFEALTLQQLNTELAAVQGAPLWAGFISLLVGAIVAAIGGMIGGMMTRPAFGYQMAYEETERHREDTREETREDVGPARDDEVRRHTDLPPHEHREGRMIDLREQEAHAGRRGEPEEYRR